MRASNAPFWLAAVWAGPSRMMTMAVKGQSHNKCTVSEALARELAMANHDNKKSIGIPNHENALSSHGTPQILRHRMQSRYSFCWVPPKRRSLLASLGG